MALLLVVGCAPDAGPDVVLHGGPIRTVNDRGDLAEAIAIRDGVIVAVGAAPDVLALATERTEVRGLDGRALLPGFVAVHEHPTLSAVFGGVADVSGFTHATGDDVWGALRRAVAGADEGEWVYAMGIDPILVPDLEMPTRASLDALAPANPVVVVSQTMHSFWANSRAFAAAGIGRDTPDPAPGAYYERDAAGELTGFVAEGAAAKPLLAELQSPWRLAARYEAVLDELLAAGFTSVTSPGFNVPPLLARWAASRRLRPRIRQFFHLAPDEIESLPERPDRSDPFFRIAGIKLWHDGSPYTGSMFLAEPYLASPLARRLGIAVGHRGEAMLAQDELAAQIARHEAAGWQIVVHSQGDASNREVVAAFAGAPAPAAGSPPRRIEHCVLLPREALPELARLGISPSFHIDHLYYYGDALADAIIGPERAARMLPLRAAFDHGLAPTLHADSPMFPADPFHLMRTAILRTTRGGRVLGPDQAITIDEAVRALTIHGARQLGVDGELGSLEVGKAADLVVLSPDPYAIAPERLGDVKVLETWVDGRRQAIPAH